MNNDDFYIGYLEKAPAPIGRFTRLVVVSLFIVTAGVALLLITGQKAFFPSTFEFLQYQSFTGTFHSHPYPMLQVMEPAPAGGVPTYRHFYLVKEGKFGTQDLAATYEGKRVTIEGTRIYRDNQEMIEIKGENLQFDDTASPLPKASPTSLGTFTLQGEIVDSKCFLGVMNPGSEKPHRACATRCISGGIPPLFVVRDDAGNISYLQLQATNGSTVNQEILHMVAEPVQITGEVMQLEDILILKADPATYQRLNS